MAIKKKSLAFGGNDTTQDYPGFQSPDSGLVPPSTQPTADKPATAGPNPHESQTQPVLDPALLPSGSSIMNALQGGGPGFVDPGTFDTGGYAQPGFTASNFAQQAPSGYDPAKWTNPQHQTPKYVVSRILSGYNLGDPSQLQAAVADIQRAYPGTTWGGRDVMNIPGIGDVDFITDFGGANGLAWQPADGAAPPSNTGPARSLFNAIQGVGAQGAGSGAGSPFQAPGSADPFASMGGGVFMNGGWTPRGMHTAEELAAYDAQQALQGGSPGGAGAPVGPAVSPTSRAGIDQILAQLLAPQGGFNQKRADARVESAREQLERTRKSQTGTITAELADRGIYSPSGGPSTTALSALEEELAGIYGGTVRDIYADETQSADERFIRALELAGGLQSDDAQNLIDQFEAETGRQVGLGNIEVGHERNAIDRLLGMENIGLGRERLGLESALGFGNLDLSKLQAEMNNNQFLARFGLDRTVAGEDIASGRRGQLIELIKAGIPLQDIIDAGFL